MALKILTWVFYLLFFFTPLIWTPWNYELFEYNKMLLVYALTVISCGAWISRMVSEKRLILKTTPLDIPILLFLFANLLSTIFSIDRHVSIWGYYSRSNGGLLSILSYSLLYFALISNFDAGKVIKFLKVAIVSGVLIAIYGILEHFGIDKDFWVQDVQARVFSTLGQPNWLAAYLAMLVFPAIYFFLKTDHLSSKIYYYVALLVLYTAFTFTYSRGATLGFIVGFISFIVFYLSRLQPRVGSLKQLNGFKPILIIVLSFVIINLVYGSALTRFKLTNFLNFGATVQQAMPAKKPVPSNVTQLENGGTESGQIRLIVWKGAFEIFKKYPFFGSGVETFAYSYYQFRPEEHNLVSEWDFLYNKAHNEFLNYLATTGAVGFLSYLVLIGSFVFWVFKQVFFVKKVSEYSLLVIALFGAYVSYHVQNFFGFSVVIIALYFFLFPAMTFVLANQTTDLKLPVFLKNLGGSFLKFLGKRPTYPKFANAAVLLIAVILVSRIYAIWDADTLFAKGSSYTDSGNVGRGYNFLKQAVDKNPNEPLFRSELAFTAASAAVAVEAEDATLSADLKKEAEDIVEDVLRESPRNVSFWRSAVRTYYQLASLDGKFSQKTIDAIDKAIELAPTDAKLYYNKGLILSQIGEEEEAIKVFGKAIGLKRNYRDAYFALGVVYWEKGEKDKALEQMGIVNKLIPNDPEMLEKLKEWDVRVEDV